MRRSIILLALCSSSACTSVEPLRPDMHAKPVPSHNDEIAFINGLRQAYKVIVTDDCFRGEGLKPFKPKYIQGYRDYTESGAVRAQCIIFDPMTGVPAATRTERVRAYLENGFGLTDLYCDRFFIVAAETRQSRQIQRNTGSAVDTLVTSVLTALGAGQSGLGILNHGFETFDATYKNIDAAFVVAPDRDDLLAVVQAAQDKIRSDTKKNPPESYPAARSAIERYASTCTFDGMRALVSSGLQQAKKTLKEGTDTTDPKKDPPVTKPESKPAEKPTAEEEKDADMIASAPST